jgi:hypothetical protein
MNNYVTTTVKHGKTLVIVAAAMIPIFLLLSDGYDPRLDLLTNFYYSLTVFDAKWHCREVQVQDTFLFRTEMKCWDVAIYTKYLVTLCVIAIMYGVLMTKELAKDPVSYLGDKFRKMRRQKDVDEQ